MIYSIFGLILVVLGLLALALQRFYSSVPARELKRLAARGDHLAAALYRPVAYGASMRLFLWVVLAVSLSAGFLLLISSLVAWAAFAVVAASLATVIWLQSVRLTVRSAALAVHASPVISKILMHVHTPFNVVAQFVNAHRSHAPHSGLYEKEDLVALLRQQKEQLDNRITPAELELIERAVQFDDAKAADIVLPWNKVRLVKTDDHIGPVLLGELHTSGQSSFVVYKDKPDNVVGTLFLRDAVSAKAGGRVPDLMHQRICFVHEDFSLRQVLTALMQTGQFMVVVINAFEEAVGVITLEHLLVQLIGEDATEEIVYEDRAHVAAWKPVLQPVEVPVIDDGPEQIPSPEPTEVVE